MSDDLQQNLNNYCVVSRKYNLNDKKFFLTKFQKVNSNYLNLAWEYSLDEIQNREIIKDAKELPKNALQEIENKLLTINNKADDLFYYLNSGFDVKELKLDEERIERQFRNILAQRHQKILESKILSIAKKEKSNFLNSSFV